MQNSQGVTLINSAASNRALDECILKCQTSVFLLLLIFGQFQYPPRQERDGQSADRMLHLRVGIENRLFYPEVEGKRNVQYNFYSVIF